MPCYSQNWLWYCYDTVYSGSWKSRFQRLQYESSLLWKPQVSEYMLSNNAIVLVEMIIFSYFLFDLNKACNRCLEHFSPKGTFPLYYLKSFVHHCKHPLFQFTSLHLWDFQHIWLHVSVGKIHPIAFCYTDTFNTVHKVFFFYFPIYLQSV
jgi:hypothetical protein